MSQRFADLGIPPLSETQNVPPRIPIRSRLFSPQLKTGPRPTTWVTGQLVGEGALPMGWMETCAMDERMRFVIAVEKREEPFAAVCRRFGVSRKAGYKWVGRYREGGVEGLLDRSRAPLNRPCAIGEELAERCLAVRRAHPTWGPLKARAFLERRGPGIAWPAASTIGLLFDREGLTVKRKLRRRSPPSSAPFAHCGAANDVWCIDFKGWFLTGEGARCEPLTLTDATSRYLLRCQALARTDGPACVAGARRGVPRVRPAAQGALRQMFAVRLDWRGRAVGPCGSSDQGRGQAGADRARQAAAERAPRAVHLTLLKDAITPPARPCASSSTASAPFSASTMERRRQALGNATPAECYQASPRRWDGVLREPDYPVRPRGPAGALERRDQMAGQARLSQLRARRRAGRPRRGRRRLDRQLRPGRSRLARPWRRPPAQTQTRPLWTCGRRCASPTGSTASRSSNRPERNENCVTHVVGQTCYPCSRLLTGALSKMCEFRRRASGREGLLANSAH